MNEIEYDYDGTPLPEGHHLITKATIGSIVFDDDDDTEEYEDQFESARYTPIGIGECKIDVYNMDGDIPHFHVYALDKSFETCICIYSPHYYSHGGKYTDKLDYEQLVQLVEWLNRPNAIQPIANTVITNWNAIAFLWESTNPMCNFPEDEKINIMPYYTEMTDYKE